MSTSNLAAGTRAGEYEVTELLGRGGMGTVYAGVHPVIGKRVAIKFLNPEYARDANLVARFVREARAVNTIGHDNIIDIFAFGEEPGVGHYFVMQHLEGKTLGERIAERGPMSLADALPIVEQIAGALDAAHSAGVLHRDLKPDNVFVTDKPGGAVVKVLDFGIAKLAEGDGLTTRTGVQMGTPLFMAPEQWDGGRDVDARTDIYALGVLIHHMLTGRFPFESRSPLALMNMHANEEPMPVSHYDGPAEADSIVAWALSKERADRPPTASLLYKALASAADNMATGQLRTAAPRPTLPPQAVLTTLESAAASMKREPTAPPPRSGGRKWIAVAVVATAAVSLAIVFALDGFGGGDDSAAVAPADAAPPPPDAAAPPPDAAAVSDAAVAATTDKVEPKKSNKHGGKRPPKKPPKKPADDKPAGDNKPVGPVKDPPKKPTDPGWGDPALPE